MHTKCHPELLSGVEWVLLRNLLRNKWLNIAARILLRLDSVRRVAQSALFSHHSRALFQGRILLIQGRASAPFCDDLLDICR